MTWDEYYSRLYDWAESTQISRMSSIEDFSDAEGHEVVEVAMSFLEEAASTRLIRKAMAGGVHFTAEDVVDVAEYIKEELLPTMALGATTVYTEEQLEYLSSFLSDADYDRLRRAKSRKSTTVKKRKKKPGLLAALFIALAGTPKNKQPQKNSRPHKHSGKCEGDCSKCPPHYGYRYGRWYYGHNHVYGCQFGGNKNP